MTGPARKLTAGERMLHASAEALLGTVPPELEEAGRRGAPMLLAVLPLVVAAVIPGLNRAALELGVESGLTVAAPVEWWATLFSPVLDRPVAVAACSAAAFLAAGALLDGDGPLARCRVAAAVVLGAAAAALGVPELPLVPTLWPAVLIALLSPGLLRLWRGSGGAA